MPIGIIINALSIVIGGILGAFVGHKLSPKFKEDITLVFGVCSMGMGISTIGLMENMPAVIFSVVKMCIRDSYIDCTKQLVAKKAGLA